MNKLKILTCDICKEEYPSGSLIWNIHQRKAGKNICVECRNINDRRSILATKKYKLLSGVR